MGVPKGRRTKSKQGHRRSHIKLSRSHLVKCKKCGESVRPHEACANCGTYKGRQVVDVLAKLTKRERKEKEKALAERSDAQQTPADVSPERLAEPKE